MGRVVGVTGCQWRVGVGQSGSMCTGLKRCGPPTRRRRGVCVGWGRGGGGGASATAVRAWLGGQGRHEGRGQWASSLAAPTRARAQLGASGERAAAGLGGGGVGVRGAQNARVTHLLQRGVGGVGVIRKGVGGVGGYKEGGG